MRGAGRSRVAAAGLLAAALLAGPERILHAAAPARRTPIVEAVERVGPAVVNIAAETRVRNPFYDDPWEGLFRGFFGAPAPESVRDSLGSGVLIDGSGSILTNEHVVNAASTIKVTLADKREFVAEVVGTAEDSDLAVLKIDSDRPLPSVPLGSSDDLMIGETVIAIGNPFGLSNSVTTGVVSALHRAGHSGQRTYTDFIQTDAAINPGNSGGALLNIDGELIGINAAIVGQAQGIGFAIPIDRARAIYRELVQYGEVRPVWLGLDLRAPDDRTAKQLGLRAGGGLLVEGVRGPAREAGIKAGDVVVKVDGAPIESNADFGTAVGRRNVGDELELTVERDGASRTVRLRAAEFPFDDYGWSTLGLRVAEIPAADRRRREVPDAGVVITDVRPDGPAARRRLQSGDYIVQLEDRRLSGLSDFRRLLPRIAAKTAQRGVFLRVVRDGYAAPVSLRID